MNLFKIFGEIAINGDKAINELKSVSSAGQDAEKKLSFDDKVNKAFGSMGDASTSLAKTVLGIGAAGMAVITGLTLKGGFERAMSIDTAKAKLKGLGHDTKTVDKIMNNALASVKGTAFGLGDAATIAAQMVASGIKPGKELEKTLKTVSDTAAIAGKPLNEMGSIFAKIAANGKLTGEELNQLGDAGIPVLDMLAKNTKIADKSMQAYGDNSKASIRQLVSDGKVSFEDFSASMDKSMGGAALKMGDSFKGTFMNLGAALGRFGEQIVTPILEWAKATANNLIPAIDKLAASIKPTLKSIKDWLSDGDRLTKILYALGTAIAVAVIPGLLNIAMGAVTALAPLLPLIAAGAALGAIFYGIQNSSGASKVALIALGAVVGTFTTILIANAVATKAVALGEALHSAALVVTSTATGMATIAKLAYNAAVLVTTGQVGLAVAAQWLWNAALAANPIGAVIMAVVGLTAVVGGLIAGIGALISGLDRGKAAAERLKEAQDKLKEASKQLKETTDSLKDAQDRLAGAELSAEGAALRVESAQKRYNEALKQHGKDSYEARQAAHELKQAQYDKEQADKNVTKSTQDVSKAQKDQRKAMNDAEKKVDDMIKKELEYIQTTGKIPSNSKISWDSIAKSVKDGTMTSEQAIQKARKAALGMMDGVDKSAKDEMFNSKQSINTNMKELQEKFKGVEFKFNKPKVPSWSMSGKFNAETGSVPNINTVWRAKGAIMKKPTIFGFDGKNLQGGGEAGAEAALPLNSKTLGSIGAGIVAATSKDNNEDNSILEEKLDKLISLIEMLISKIVNQRVYLDKNDIDKALQSNNALRLRGVTT